MTTRLLGVFLVSVLSAAPVHVLKAEETAGKEPKLSAQNAKELSAEDRLKLLEKIEEKLHELNLKELQVQKFKDELEIQKSGVEERIKHLEQLKNELAERLDHKMQQDMKAIKEMTKVYESMNPKQAAQIMETLDLDMARVVLKNMPQKKSADILNKISRDRAVKLSEYYAGFNPPQKERTLDSLRRSTVDDVMKRQPAEGTE